MATSAVPAASLGDATVQELREGLRGDLIGPRDAGYDEARSVWNGGIDRRPALIARCAGVADVITAVRFARSQQLTIAVRGGGHSVAGFGTCDDGMVIDLGPMNGIRVDPAARTVRAEGGATWADLDHETQAFGLATTGGLVSTTGIAGFTLGGGIGWLMRKHGLASDNLIAADLVTADGELIRASETDNPGLLWGLRGGGGNFGIVTSFQYRLHPVGPLVYGGLILHPASRAAELLRFYAEWTTTLPDELTTVVVLLTAPPEPFIPAELHGTPMIAVACCHTGPTADAEAAIKDLRAFADPVADLIGPIPYAALQAMSDAGAPRGVHWYFKTEYLHDLTDEAIDMLVERGRALQDLSPFSAIHLHHLEGAVRRQPPGGSAFAHRDPRFVLNLIGGWIDPAAAAAHVGWARDSWQAIRPHATGDPYLNFLGDEGPDRVRAAYGDDTFQRLVALKQAYDPANTFHLNQNIPPAEAVKNPSLTP
jgi:FAD/FMN-containing dehydrogenase